MNLPYFSELGHAHSSLSTSWPKVACRLTRLSPGDWCFGTCLSAAQCFCPCMFSFVRDLDPEALVAKMLKIICFMRRLLGLGI